MKKKLNILMLAPYPIDTDHSIGGVESVTSTLIEALSKNEKIKKITIISLNSNQKNSIRFTNGEKIEIIQIPPQKIFALPTRSFINYLEIKNLTSSIDYDIVHAQGLSSYGDFAIRLSKNAIITVHGLIHKEININNNKNFKKYAQEKLLLHQFKRILRNSRVIISTSNYDFTEVKNHISCDHITIPNPISNFFFIGQPTDFIQGRFLFAGMMVRRKNIEGILNSFSQLVGKLPFLQLVICGPEIDIVYKKELTKLASQIGLQDHVEFLGHVTLTELREEMNKAQALILFSKEETLPTIIGQAMAMGKPIISSNVGGVQEMIINNETGYLINSCDEDNLANYINIISNDPINSIIMGKEGKRIALENFSPENVAKQTIKVYQNIYGS